MDERVNHSTAEPEHRKKVRMLLMRWGCAESYCKERHERIAELNATIESLGGLSSREGLPAVGAGGKSDPTGAAAEKLIRLGASYTERINELTADCEREQLFARELDALMARLLTVPERNVLAARYRPGADGVQSSWSDVASKCYYTPSRAKSIEISAVEKLHTELKFDPL